MSSLCRCGKHFVVPFFLTGLEFFAFSILFRRLFNRGRPPFRGISPCFSTTRQIPKNSFVHEYFFVFSHRRAGFLHRLFHNLWKTFGESFRSLSYLSAKAGQPTTFPRQINDISRFFTCHTDKLTDFFRNFVDFSLIFAPRHEFSAFPHEFSTECGKSCGKPFGNFFRQDPKTPYRAMEIP